MTVDNSKNNTTEADADFNAPLKIFTELEDEDEDTEPEAKGTKKATKKAPKKAKKAPKKASKKAPKPAKKTKAAKGGRTVLIQVRVTPRMANALNKSAADKKLRGRATLVFQLLSREAVRVDAGAA